MCRSRAWNRAENDAPFLPLFLPSNAATDILLQLKRTVEVVSLLNATKGGGGRGRIKTLLDGSLSAGKAARNERVVPEIRKLKEFGSDGTPPSALARVVAEVRNSRDIPRSKCPRCRVRSIHIS